MIAPAPRATFRYGKRKCDLSFTESDILGAVVFASHRTDGLHFAADEGRLDPFMIEFDEDSPQAPWGDYGATKPQAFKKHRLSLLGEFGTPFHVGRVGCFVPPTPALSLVAPFNAGS